MTNRREFLQIGITATAWPLAPTAVRAAAQAPAADPLPLYKVVYDERFAASIAFAERAAVLGLVTHAIAGDVTRLWYEELYHRWKEGPVALAGLTAHGAMFCLEHLGRDHGLRVVFRAEHKVPAGGVVEHEMTGPLTMLREGLALDTGVPWPACLADLVAHCPRGRAEVSRATAAGPAGPDSRAAGAEALYSWVIAPAVKR